MYILYLPLLVSLATLFIGAKVDRAKLHKRPGARPRLLHFICPFRKKSSMRIKLHYSRTYKFPPGLQLMSAYFGYLAKSFLSLRCENQIKREWVGKDAHAQGNYTLRQSLLYAFGTPARQRFFFSEISDY
jgi:hypothetical protein